MTGVDSQNVPGQYEASDQASFKEGVGYLGERPTRLTNTIAGSAPTAPGAAPAAAPAAGARPGRRISFGTVPDFAFPGPGMKVASVMPGSPAEKADVQSGDVIVRIDAQPIASLQAYADVLELLKPSQTIEVIVSRGGQEQKLTATVVER